jgi:hypothetical protein
MTNIVVSVVVLLSVIPSGVIENLAIAEQAQERLLRQSRNLWLMNPIVALLSYSAITENLPIERAWNVGITQRARS